VLCLFLTNPFGARAVRRLYIPPRHARHLGKARHIAYEKKWHKRHPKEAKLHQEHQSISHRRCAGHVARHREPKRDVHLFHGHLFAPTTETALLRVSGVTGEDVAMAMAMAETHAVGCMMPLSVFLQ
jgi:hypothetical protein